MKLVLPVTCLGLMVLALSGRADDAKPATSLTLDLTKPGLSVSPTFYGLMTEEINHSYEGGLYGELIQNRSFKDNDREPAHWTVVQEGGGAGSIALDRSHAGHAEADGAGRDLEERGDVAGRQELQRCGMDSEVVHGRFSYGQQ